MNICRGCGGTGLDANITPRAAQMASLPILMHKAAGLIEGGGTSNIFRGQLASAPGETGRMRFSGPLIPLAEHVAQRIKNGYAIVEGEQPDRSLACEWCNGHGSPDGQLTVHALEKLAET